MTESTRLLVVEDDSTFGDVLSDHFAARGFEMSWAHCAEEGRVMARSVRPDVIILDQHLPDGDGVTLAQELISDRMPIKIILVTAYADLTRAVAATKAGVYEYLPKPIELPKLEDTIRRAAQAGDAEREGSRPTTRRSCIKPPPLVGESPPLAHLREQLEAAGRACPAPVVVTGETGTGKGLAARLIHAHSPRARGPFLVVNSAAIPEALMEAELFGYERGAFTGASEARIGLFEAAHGGTLVLDEIGEMPPLLQAKLLRTLEDRVVRRVGAATERSVDVRLVATTNRPIEDLVQQGAFRPDLYYRIAVFRIEMPPLRDRRADIPSLAGTLLRELGAPPTSRLSQRDSDHLVSHDWPGNVRELRNVLQRWLAARHGQHPIEMDDVLLPLRRHRLHAIAGAASSAPTRRFLDEANVGDRFPTLAEIEVMHIRKVLEHTQQNRSKAAQLLGISRAKLRRKLRESAGGP